MINSIQELNRNNLLYYVFFSNTSKTNSLIFLNIFDSKVEHWHINKHITPIAEKCDG